MKVNKAQGSAVLVAMVAASTALVTGPAAVADDGGDEFVISTGRCSGSADWKLKAKHDDGRVEWEFEVDSNRVGQTWNVRVRDNGDLVARTQQVTGGRSGSFELERKTANKAGTDHFVARARHGASGQTCVGRVDL